MKDQKILYPATKLFPHHPQVLHQLALQLFTMADKYEKIFTSVEMTHGIIMPWGSYFDTGLMQAAAHRFRLKAIKPKKIVLISLASLPEDISIIGSAHKEIHTFFGVLAVENPKMKTLTLDDILFAAHGDPIIAQLPFIRSYHKVEAICPLIVNTKNPTQARETLRSEIWDSSGDTGYMICTNQIDENLEDIAGAYEQVTGEQFMSFDFQEKTS